MWFHEDFASSILINLCLFGSIVPALSEGAKSPLRQKVNNTTRVKIYKNMIYKYINTDLVMYKYSVGPERYILLILLGKILKECFLASVYFERLDTAHWYGVRSVNTSQCGQCRAVLESMIIMKTAINYNFQLAILS